MRPQKALHLSDLELARAALSGDGDAFRAVFDFAFPRLYRFALAHTKDADAAEEAVQGTLCAAFAHLGDYRGEAALLTWMTTICRRELGARRPRKETARAPEVDEAWLESLPADLEGAADRMERTEVAARVHAVLDWLPRRYSELLAWKYFEERTVADIAGRLGVGIKAAESRLTRAREAFRREFEALSEATPHSDSWTA